MKRAILKELHGTQKQLLSLGKQLYLLEKSEAEEGKSSGGLTFEPYKITKSQAFESKVRFDIAQARDAILVIDEQIKAVHSYSLESFLGGAGPATLKAQNWVKKKLTEVIAVKSKVGVRDIEGVLVSDRVGEVKFLSFDRLEAEGIKPDFVPGQGPEGLDNEKEETAKTLFGQQQETVALGLSGDGQTLVAIDTLNRIRISDFPNVFNIRHMILQHKNRITDCTFIGSAQLATYSALDNHLLVTDIHTGAVLHSTKQPLPAGSGVIESFTSSRKHDSTNNERLCVVTVDEQSGQGDYTVRAFTKDFAKLETVMEGIAGAGEGLSLHATTDGKLVRVKEVSEPAVDGQNPSDKIIAEIEIAQL